MYPVPLFSTDAKIRGVPDRLAPLAVRDDSIRAMAEPTPLFLSSGDLIADRRYQHARDLAARGDLQAAADLFAQAVERAPDFASAWFGARGGARAARRRRSRDRGI